MKVVSGLKYADVHLDERRAAFTMVRAALALLVQGHCTFRFHVPEGSCVQIPDHAEIVNAPTVDAQRE